MRRLLLPLLLLATPALAADPVGMWELDRQAWERFVERLVPRLVARIPEGQRAAMAAQGIDLEAQIRGNFAHGLDGTLELRPGGRVIARDGEEVEDGAGLWQDDGREIEIALPGEGLVMRGPFTAERMELRPLLDEAELTAAAEDPLWQEALGEMVFVLVRRP
jgi:hypothetical protein